jgi:hypothetical protein
MIQALKGAFMGDIGLLLNDPYKRDRIDGCLLDIFRILFSLFEVNSLRVEGKGTRGKNGYFEGRGLLLIAPDIDSMMWMRLC